MSIIFYLIIGFWKCWMIFKKLNLLQDTIIAIRLETLTMARLSAHEEIFYVTREMFPNYNNPCKNISYKESFL